MKVQVCNYYHQKCCIELQKGAQKICPKCKGHGGFLVGASFRNGKFKVSECTLCKGDGKVDWITSIRAPGTHHPFQTTAVKYNNIKCPAKPGCKKIKRYWKNRKYKSLGGYTVTAEMKNDE